MHVYFDNASTTQLAPAVYQAMAPYQQTHYGNAASLHAWGREAKVALEKARSSIADCLQVSTDQICFTSGGTESNNTILWGMVPQHKHIITSPLEHKAVLAPLQYLSQQANVTLHFVELTQNGHLDYNHLAELLKKYRGAFVTLMHGNNEIGNTSDINLVAKLCQAANAKLHTDMVQTLAHYPLSLAQPGIHAATASAHKLHGPKGIGITYQVGIHQPLLHGGSQERGMRAGTQPVAAIVGFAKALHIACQNQKEHVAHLRTLKQHMIDKLGEALPDIQFHGDIKPHTSLPHILNVALPTYARTDMVLFALDMAHIAAAAGSACTSGTTATSHVLQALHRNKNNPQGIRFSFSRYNTLTEVEYVVAHFARILKKQHQLSATTVRHKS